MQATIRSRNGQSMNSTHPASTTARRGSALIIVIGTLALISVFAAIYISIGQTDRRTASTVRSRTDLGEITGAYADHIARVIAEDRFDSVMQVLDEGRFYQSPRRVTTDAPYTDWSMRTEDINPWRLFNPAGGNRYAVPIATLNQGGDPRVASDPWLASLRPTYLGNPFSRPFSLNDPSRAYLDNRDFFQITNIAPDGRFVNLFNLRNNFRAEPGWGNSLIPGIANSPRLSEGLSLYRKRQSNNPASAIQSFDPLVEGIWLPGSDAPVTGALSADEIRNTPAVFTMYQRFALIPADQPFLTYNRQGQISSWEDRDYPAYQWADADGDGFYDSRWFELTAARQPHTGNARRDDVQYFYDNSEFRVFAAVRVIDLSGMVNVNTATDALGPPTEQYPLGLTPADIDLRRLLTMQDSASDFNSYRNEPLSLRDIHPPRLIQGSTQPSESDYAAYTQQRLSTGDPGSQLDPDSSAMLVGRFAAAAARRGMARHSTLGPQYRGSNPPDPGLGEPFLLQEGSSFQRIGQDPATQHNLYASARYGSYLSVGRVDPSRVGLSGMSPYEVDDLGDYFDGTNTTLPYALYGIDDLAELLTFHGINDPETTTRLERNTLGRYEGVFGEDRLSPLLSTRPLDLDRYRHGLVRLNNNPDPSRPRRVDGQIADESMALLELSPRALLTTIGGSVPLRPLGAAGNNIQSSQGARSNPFGLAESEAAVSFEEIAADTSRSFSVFYQALAGELEAYRSKGAGSGPPVGIINRMWPADLTQRRTVPAGHYATLFYAHRGPELAVRIAAHAALNLKDKYDGFGTGPNPTPVAPSVGTLVLDNQFGELPGYRNLINTIQNQGTVQAFDLRSANGLLAVSFPGLTPKPRANLAAANGFVGRFDLDAPRLWELPRPDNPVLPDQRVLPTDNLPERRQAVNVIGVEPMPVISEVASFYLYTDAAQSAGGDSDNAPAPVIGQPNQPGALTTRPVTISGTLDIDNPDLLASVVAFQLHNPFDVSINLGGGTGPNGVMWRLDDRLTPDSAAAGTYPENFQVTDNFNPDNNLQFNYYIEYNGHFFKLGEFWEYTPDNDIPAGFTDTQRQQITDRNGTAPSPRTRLDNSLPEFQYRSVVLSPGETRVFYVMSHPRFDWVERSTFTNGLEAQWVRVLQSYGGNVLDEFVNPTPENDPDGDGLANGFDTRGWSGVAQEWIERQLAVQLDSADSTLRPAARLHPFDPRTGELTSEGVFVDFVGTPGTIFPASRADDSQVRLWRKHVAAPYEEATRRTLQHLNFSGGTPENLIQNDILVDRLYLTEPLEGFSYLDVALPSGQNEISDTVSFPESYTIVADPCNSTALNRRNDNTGLTVMRWASVRRRDQPASLGDETVFGRVLPWMVQSRNNPSSTWIRRTNRPGRPGASGTHTIPDSLSWDVFYDLCPGGGDPEFITTAVDQFGRSDPRRYDITYTPQDMFVTGMRREGLRIATIGNTPFNKQNDTLINEGDGDPGDRFGNPVRLSHTFGDQLFEANSAIRPEVFLRKEIESARIAEALLVMGIGPTWTPPNNPPRALGNFDFDDEEWMTLPEAMAAALGYETFNLTDPAEANAANAVWHDAVRTIAATPSQPEYVLDNLRLRLDDYVSFLNLVLPGETGDNEKPRFTTTASNPAAQTDMRRGLGVPIALGVLDQLRPFGVLPLPGDRDEDLDGSLRLTRPVMGLVNVQTAPLRVLRLLPGLTPSAEPYRPNELNPGTRNTEWWGAAGGFITGTGVAQLQPGLPLDNPDAAAGIAAYRDRLVSQPRVRSQPTSVTAPYSYQPDPSVNSVWAVRNMLSEFSDPSGYAVDRAGVSGIPGLRGTPMFASLGELLAVTARETLANGTPDPLANERRHLTMQGYFGNSVNLGVSGTGDNAVTMDPMISNGTASSVTDDYAERIALAAGVMNTTSVRSDYFAAWMIVQGFRNTDVSGLRPEDPLVPSFKKRYLMILDRSNVVEPQDAPRIILFREVPL